MFDIIKSIVWILGVLVLGFFLMGYFGYEINSEYFNYSKKECQDRLAECSELLVRKGIDNAKCDFKCVDPQLIIRKK